VNCFLRFVPAENRDDWCVESVRKFQPHISSDRSIIFSISSSPYDPVSHSLYEREFLDENGYDDDANVQSFAEVLEVFLGEIKGADEYLMVCSEGEDIKENFAVAEAKTVDFAEVFTAIYIGGADHFPSMVICGRWS
jgi:hypothetical protein